MTQTTTPMTTRNERTREWLDAVNHFPPSVCADIDSIWDTQGCMPPHVVQRVLGNLKLELADIGKLMMQLLPVAKQYAVVPISGFQVGAVAAGKPMPGTGWCSLYLGANFEVANAALSCTVHAEQSAINNAWLNGEGGVQALAVSAAPCGYCRQFLYELVGVGDLQIILPSNPTNTLPYTMRKLTEFLPDPFGPNDLGVKGGMMDPALGHHQLSLIGPAPTDAPIKAALEAASQSYAPYKTRSSCGFAGVSIQLDNEAQTIYAGRYAENAAYNPSLLPLQSALAFMTMNEKIGSACGLKRCILVEVPTRTSQRGAAETVLASYAPGVPLEYYTASVNP